MNAVKEELKGATRMPFFFLKTLFNQISSRMRSRSSLGPIFPALLQPTCSYFQDLDKEDDESTAHFPAFL